jgi:periplasmic protein TonB
MPDTVGSDVYSATEIAAAAGTTEARVESLIARGEIRSVGALAGRGDAASYVAHAEAVRAVRALRSGSNVAVPDALGLGRELLSDRVSKNRSGTMPFVVSTSLHAIVAATILIVASLGLASADEPTLPIENPDPIRLVFLAIPGPGGGGGGGGLRVPKPPSKAERKGPEKISSPLPARELPPPIRPVPKPPEPPKPLEAKQLPPVMAPIVIKPAETRDVEGVLAKVPEAPPSPGPGSGGSVGSGKGTGIGQGDGPGVGEGSGGGRPYRPGSDVEPPRLLREVKADYSDDARRANIEGEVLLEIVVRSNGSVGDVKVLRGLRGGLNERAIEAVRQWRFAPARMKGTPVDVVVEVGVEFRLR